MISFIQPSLVIFLRGILIANPDILFSASHTDRVSNVGGTTPHRKKKVKTLTADSWKPSFPTICVFLLSRWEGWAFKIVDWNPGRFFSRIVEFGWCFLVCVVPKVLRKLCALVFFPGDCKSNGADTCVCFFLLTKVPWDFLETVTRKKTCFCHWWWRNSFQYAWRGATTQCFSDIDFD